MVKRLSLFLFLAFIGLSGCKIKKVAKERLCSRIDLERIISLIPKSVQEAQDLSVASQKSMNEVIKSVGDIKAEERTFSNTIRPYDHAKFEFLMNKHILSAMSFLSDNQELQLEATAQSKILDQYDKNVLQKNVVLYEALQEYREHGKDTASKTVPNKYFVQKMLQQYKREGVELPVAQRTELVGLDKDIKRLVSQYTSNIDHDSRKLIVPSKDLAGVPQSFLNSLRKDSQGDYIVPITQKSYTAVMQTCQVARTRKQFYLAYGQRAYPQNMSILQDILQLRHGYAAKLGYSDFASYQLHPLMIKQTKKAEQFLWNFVSELQKYAIADYQEFIKDLPVSVTLTKDKKIKPWDYDFVVASYRKKHFQTHQDLAEYFQLEQTFDKLLQLLKVLFYIEFEKLPVNPDQLWAQDVSCYRVRSLKNQAAIGYVFVDLFKRPDKKITHTMYMQLVPTIKDDCSISCVGASIVAANFNPSTEEKSTLLTLDQVSTLFKQLGLALHELLGATCFVDFSGTTIEQDFLHATSQVLELWLQSPKALHTVSSHYQMGHKLPKDKIEQLHALKDFDKVHTLLQDAYMGLVALSMYKDGYTKDNRKAIEKLYKKVFKHIAYEQSYFFEYGDKRFVTDAAACFTPLWAKSIGADFYDHMQQAGMNYDIGKEYMKHILQPGGFAAPVVMAKRFLKRSLNPYALFKQLRKE